VIPRRTETVGSSGVNLKTRTALMLERIDAMKQIWGEERAEYHVKQGDFDPIFQWPKPLQQPHPPILMGGMGPTVLDRTLSHADGWIPGHTDDSFDSLGDRITELRERAAALGKPMEVTLNLGRPGFVDRYADMDLDRVVYQLRGHGVGISHRRHQIDDRLGGKPGNRRGPDMLDPVHQPRRQQPGQPCTLGPRPVTQPGIMRTDLRLLIRPQRDSITHAATLARPPDHLTGQRCLPSALAPAHRRW